MSQINTSEMKVNQIALLMNTITIVKINESEFILIGKEEKIKKSKLPFDTDVELKDKSTLQQAVLQAQHQGDCYSLMLSSMLTKRILPQIN